MSEAMTELLADSTATLVYHLGDISVYQCDVSESFVLCLGTDRISFRVCEFIAFRRRLQQVDLDSLVASDSPDLEIIYLPHCDRLFVLTASQVLALRELLAGSLVMLELNSIIHRTILRKGR